MTEPLGLSVQVEFQRVIDTLRADVEWLRHAAANNAQRAALEGRDPRRPDGTAWADSDEARSERRAEEEAALEAFKAEWGFHPTEEQFIRFLQARKESV